MISKRLKLCCLAIALVTADGARAQTAEKTETRREFRLQSIQGKMIELRATPQPKLTVVCFLGAECPLAKLYGPRLETLAREFSGKVEFLGICSNQQDSIADLVQYAQRHQMSFPLAKDPQNKVADAFAAKRTPEVVVLDQQLAIRYRGRIDDQYLPGIVKAAATRQDLRLALEELLAHKPVSQPRTEPVGCLIGRVKQAQGNSNVTYARHVSRILQRNCVECHRQGEIGPFALTDYDEVTGWADMMLEVIDNGRMPPWHASPDHGEFQNARRMPEADKHALREWVAAGTPFGNDKDLPAAVSYTQGWRLPREPDLVLEMSEKPFVVPPHGTVEYQYYVVDPGFTEDKWISAAQIIPGNRAVVHHCIAFVRPPDGARFRGVGWITAYVPGQSHLRFPAGYARRIPAKSKLIFQMHYTPTGTPQEDQTRIGIVFAEPSEVTHELYTLMAIDQEFEIAAHSPDARVETRLKKVPAAGQLLAITPHMHLRGKAFRLSLVEKNPAGQTGARTLLEVPQFDFNWQHTYQFAQPLPLKTVQSLRAAFTFDNSPANLTNPDPAQYVTWGDQTWEEMAVAFLEIAEPRKTATAPADRPSIKRNATAHADEAADLKRNAFATDFIKKFDVNGDGVVERNETPISFRRFGFSRYDQDGNGRLTIEEMRDAARSRSR